MFILLVLLLLLIFITSMLGVYNYIPETNHVSRVYILQLFCTYNLWYMWCYFPSWFFCTFTLLLSEVCVQCPLSLVSVVPIFRAFPACCSGIFWVILRSYTINKQMHIYKYAESPIVILQQHVSVSAVTDIRVSYNKNTINIILYWLSIYIIILRSLYYRYKTL